MTEPRTLEQDPDYVPTGMVRTSAIVVALAIAASIGATLLLADWHRLGESMRVTSRPPSRIELIVFPRETEAEAERRLGAERLRSYGWVDRDRGLVHVPLEVATELYLREAAK